MIARGPVDRSPKDIFFENVEEAYFKEAGSSAEERLPLEEIQKAAEARWKELSSTHPVGERKVDTARGAGHARRG